MPGKPRRPQEQMFEVLAYKPDGTFFSWYRVNAHDLLSIKGQPRGPRWGGRWLATLHKDLERASGPPGFLDMPSVADDRVSASLLSFSPGTALVELHRTSEAGHGELVALASLHLEVDAKAGALFARLVRQTIPYWHNLTLTEDLLTSASQSVLFLVQAPGEAAHTHWLTIYEGALLMMAAYCRDES